MCRPGTQQSVEVLESVLPKLGGENPPEPPEAFRPDPPPAPPTQDQILLEDVKALEADCAAAAVNREDPADRRFSDLFGEFAQVYDRVFATVTHSHPYAGFGPHIQAAVAIGLMTCDRLDALLELMQEPEVPVPDPAELKQQAIDKEQERRRREDGRKAPG